MWCMLEHNVDNMTVKSLWENKSTIEPDIDCSPTSLLKHHLVLICQPLPKWPTTNQVTGTHRHARRHCSDELPQRSRTHSHIQNGRQDLSTQGQTQFPCKLKRKIVFVLEATNDVQSLSLQSPQHSHGSHKTEKELTRWTSDPLAETITRHDA